MIVDTTQTHIETLIEKIAERDDVFQFVTQLLNAGKLPTYAMFEERGWDYRKHVHIMVSMTRAQIVVQRLAAGERCDED